MRITLSTSNCNSERWYFIEESANSEIEIKLEIDKIISVQSRNNRKVEICEAIQDELSKFKWIVAGSVNVEFLWYLNGVERQETDKVGDIDNITKPILDSLTGERGILIDDSQIGSLHTFWQSRNESIAFNVLYLRISINNDYCLLKENLYFIQYSGPVCVPINIDFSDPTSILFALGLLWARRKHRQCAEKIKKVGCDADRSLVYSEWDIHKTRLHGFDKNQVLSVKCLKQRCYESGFTSKLLKSMWRAKRD
jgi:Holliday junction resolvase RusA-like endonuclease